MIGVATGETSGTATEEWAAWTAPTTSATATTSPAPGRPVLPLSRAALNRRAEPDSLGQAKVEVKMRGSGSVINGRDFRTSRRRRVEGAERRANKWWGSDSFALGRSRWRQIPDDR